MSLLSRDFFAPVSWDSSDQYEEVFANRLYEIWREIPGGHKWIHYFDTYQAVLSRFADQPIRMLEIGVYKGGSLRMWRNSLTPESLVVGIDIDPSCQQYERPEENLFVRIGDQSSESFLSELVQEFGPFDIIVDDGSHICSHMIASFNYLFFSGLKDPGIYLVEDTHSNFWEGHRDQKYSFIDLCKDLVDFMHAHYWDNQSELAFRLNHAERKETITVPRVCLEIDEIRFQDSLVTIFKNRKSKTPISVHL